MILFKKYKFNSHFLNLSFMLFPIHRLVVVFFYKIVIKIQTSHFSIFILPLLCNVKVVGLPNCDSIDLIKVR